MKITRKNDLSLRLLEIFEALMRCQTTVGAAEDLGISQPAVSNGISALEKQLGFSLFERTGRKLQPTEDARLFLAEVEPLFSILRNIETEARELRAAKSGRLRLSTTPPLGHGALPSILSAFLEDRPNATVRYSVRRLDTVLQNVKMGIVDMGFVLGLKTHLDLDVIELAQQNMVCVLPIGHPLEARAVVSPQDLAGSRLIGLESHIGTTIRHAFEETGAPFDAKVEARYCHTACILAAQGIGAAVVDPYSALFASNLNIVTRPFVPETKIVASVAVRRGANMPRIAIDFIEQVKRELARKDPSGLV